MIQTITEDIAIDMGLTHEGTLYWVPAWLKETQGEVVGVPKLYCLRHWCNFADLVLETFMSFMPESLEVRTPYTLKRRIYKK